MNYSKDGVTVAAMFDSAHPKKSGKCSVKIRVTYNRVRHYYPTGKDLMPAEWDALPTTKARALVEIRKDIESSYQIVRTAVEDLLMRGIFSLENLNNRLKRAGGDTLNIAFEGKIAEMKAQERIGNMMAYRVVMKGIERFAGPRVLCRVFRWIGFVVTKSSCLKRVKAVLPSEYICDIYGQYSTT